LWKLFIKVGQSRRIPYWHPSKGGLTRFSGWWRPHFPPPVHRRDTGSRCCLPPAGGSDDDCNAICQREGAVGEYPERGELFAVCVIVSYTPIIERLGQQDSLHKLLYYQSSDLTARQIGHCPQTLRSTQTRSLTEPISFFPTSY
jgi:hypothetical protein